MTPTSLKQQHNTSRGIKWTAKTEYYDIETGLQITKTEYEKNYIKIKTNKNVTINNTNTKGTIQYTIECRRNPQTELKLN